MTLPLIRKELRQHWAAFLALGLLVVLVMALVALGTMMRGFSATVLDSIRLVLIVILPVAAALVCGRLFVAEYRAKTQLFLESLPLTRSRMVAVKFVFGLVVLCGITVMVILGAAVLGARHDVLSGRFVAILLARGLAVAAFWHAFFFATGLLGRYRWPICILLSITLAMVDAMTAFEVRKFAVFELLGEEFAHEREVFPIAHLRVTAIGAAVLTFFGAMLALVSAGGVSAMLAEKMSHREKVSVAVLILGALFAVSVIEQRKPGKPLDLPGASEAVREGVRVKIAGDEAAAKPLAEFTADELLALGGYLGIAEWPPVFVSERADLDADKYERATGDAKRGFLVRANLRDRAFDRRRFLAWLIGELLDHRSHERTQFEQYRWARDGIGDFWARRDGESTRELTLRALYGTADAPPDAQTFSRWLRARERVGDGIARGMAWSALKTIEQHRGAGECRAYLAAMFGPEIEHDFRGMLADWRNPPASRLRATTTLDARSLAALWRDDLARERAGSDAGMLPRIRLDVSIDAVSGQSSAVAYEVKIHPASASREFRIRYDTLPPLDLDTDETKLREEIHADGAPGPHRLPENFPRGGRIVIGAALRVPALGCDVISGWQRITLHPVPAR